MRIANCWWVLTLVVAATGCDGALATDPGSGPTAVPGPESPTPACPIDPDAYIGGDPSLYECPDYWVCETTPTGKQCTNPGPDFPDSTHEWTCEDVGATTVCRGTSFPDGGGDGAWSCELQGEFVVCTDSTPSYPDEPSDGPWSCYFSGEFRICESGGSGPDAGDWTCFDTATGRECRESTPSYPDDREWTCYDSAGMTVCTAPGSLPDSPGDSGWVCESAGEFVICRDTTPDYPDEGGGTPWDCYYAGEFRVCSSDGPPDGGGDVCVPGVQRWCDDAVYCSWGKATCTPDGRWGPCLEPTISSTGLSDRPNNACGCRYFFFHEPCCEDQMDRDGDGHPDCLIPSTHTVPTCASDGSLCSYCNTHDDCGGAADLCLFTRDGAALCGRDCSTSGCPVGYECLLIATRSGTSQQCAPTAGACE